MGSELGVWSFRARVVDVVDGDTIDVQVDVGFRMRREVRLRLAYVDTHETYGVEHESTEYKRGKREAEFVREWLSSAAQEYPDWPIVVETEKTGKYGRYIATITRRSDGEVLNDRLLDEFEGVENE